MPAIIIPEIALTSQESFFKDVPLRPPKIFEPIAGPGLVKAWGKFTGATEYYWGKTGSFWERLFFPKR